MKGLIFLGSSGCGKTSLCFAVKQFLSSSDNFPIFVNLDPGNKVILSNYDINIQDLVNSFEIIPELNVGPNGSLLYSIEYFEKNNDWFEDKFINLTKNVNHPYFLVDLPGQIELFTHHISVRNFIKKIISIKINLVGLILTDAFFFKDKSSNNSLFLVCIIIMLNIEIPHIHLLSKSDLFEHQNVIQNFNNLNSIKAKYISNTLPKSCFSWSKQLFYDLSNTLVYYSSINSIPVSIYYPTSIQQIFNRINTIIKS